MQICLLRRVSPGRRNFCCNYWTRQTRPTRMRCRAVSGPRAHAGAGRQPHRLLVAPRLRRGVAASFVVGRPAQVDDGQTLFHRGRDGATAGAADVPVSRSAGSHPAAQTGQQGIRAQGGQRVDAAHHRTGRRVTGPRRPARPLRCGQRSGLPTSGDGHLHELLEDPLQDKVEFSRASALLAQALDPFFMVTGQPAGAASTERDSEPGSGCGDTCTT